MYVCEIPTKGPTVATVGLFYGLVPCREEPKFLFVGGWGAGGDIFCYNSCLGFICHTNTTTNSKCCLRSIQGFKISGANNLALVVVHSRCVFVRHIFAFDNWTIITQFKNLQVLTACGLLRIWFSANIFFVIQFRYTLTKYIFQRNFFFLGGVGDGSAYSYRIFQI